MLDWSLKWMILPNKRGANLKLQLLKVRHMLRPTFLSFLPNIRTLSPEFEVNGKLANKKGHKKISMLW
jgi:hypothetical protein